MKKLADQSPPVPRGRDQLSSYRSWRLEPQRAAHGRQDHNSQHTSRQHRTLLAGSFTLTGQLDGGRRGKTNASYRKTSNKAEEAGASSLLTLSSENLPLKGRAEPVGRRQCGGSLKVRRRVGEPRRSPIRPRAGCYGVAGGGAGGGAWPRCGAARNPSWRPQGLVSIFERRWTWSRLQGPTAKKGALPRHTPPLAGVAGSLGSAGDVTAQRRQSPKPGEGCHGETPGSGQLRRRASSPVTASRFGTAGVLRPLQLCSSSGPSRVVSVSAYLGHSVS